MNLCEEIKARSLTALLADFDNACAEAPPLGRRAKLEEIRGDKGEQAARQCIGKWLRGETLFRQDFEPFLSARTNPLALDIPFPGRRAGAKLRNFLAAAVE